MARRKGEAHDDTLRVSLLDAAGDLLHAEGPQGLSTRKLAERVGTSTQAIYTLFGGKEGIVRAMYREGFDRLAKTLAAVGDRADPAEDLLGLGRAYRLAARRSPHYYDVMFGHPVPEFTPSTDDLEHSHATQRVLQAGIERCADAGMLVDGADTREISTFLWAAAHGLVSLELNGFLDLGGDPEASPVFDGYLMASLAAWARR